MKTETVRWPDAALFRGIPDAELLKQEMLKEKAQVTFHAAYQAGVEVVRDGRVSKETEAEIQKPLLKADEVAELANLWWNSYLEGFAQGKPQGRGKMEDMRLLLRGMAATFNPQVAGNLKATIQFEVTGKQPGKWFFSIENRRCSYHEGKADSPNLTIQTPSEVWLAISNNELDAQQAFMDGKYSVQGDIGLLMRMKNLFGMGLTTTSVFTSVNLYFYYGFFHLTLFLCCCDFSSGDQTFELFKRPF